MSDPVLVRLGSMLIHARPRGRSVSFSTILRPGTVGIQGVGKEFQSAIQGLHVDENPAWMVHFYGLEGKMSEAVPAHFPGLGRPYYAGADLWSLCEVLLHPTAEVLGFSPDNSNYGLLTPLADRDAPVRAKINWPYGHFVGFRPTDPNWAWNSGTIFLATTDP